MKKILTTLVIMSLSVLFLTSPVFAQTITIDQAKVLVETYSNDPKPLSLRKFGEAFLALADSQEGEENYEDALKNYRTAAKIFNDIIEAQDNRDYDERKSLKYYDYVLPVFDNRDFCRFKVAFMELKIGDKIKARSDFLAVIRSAGTKSTKTYVQESLKILQEKFNIAMEDLKDLGIGKI